MSVEIEEKIRPTVLLVEDKPYILQQREEVFKSFNFDTVAAENYESALAKFRSTPNISFLATDINLDPNDDDNQDGIQLAVDVHSIMPELPMVALSGVVSEQTFKQSKKSVLFKDSLTKGTGLDKLRQKLPQWHTWAVDYLKKRITAREEELKRLKNKYRVSDYDFELMREFIPLPLESSADLDALLSSKGYRLQIIETTGLPEECIREGIRILKSIPIWIHETDGIFVAEVYGFPQLYASGGTEAEAVGLVLILMHGFFQDFKALTEVGEEEHPLVAQLRHYLQSLFSTK